MSRAKTASDEDFPVATRLLRADLRPAVLRFYRLARAGDGIADDPALSPPDRLTRLEALAHEADSFPAGAAHLRRLWQGFRRDAAGWCPATAADLLDHCHLTAAPVADFLLDLHGEPPFAAAPARSLAVALQLLNHAKDRAEDEAARRPRLPPDLPTPAVLDLAAQQLEAAKTLPRLLLAPGLTRQTAATLAIATVHLRRLRKGNRSPGLSGWLAGAWAALRPLPRQPLPASSFALAIASLRGDQRRGLLALYGFCRGLDDAVDGPGPTALEPWRAALTALAGGRWQAPMPPDLCWAVSRFGLAQADLTAVLAGVETDLSPVVGPTDDDFTLYCDRVAGAVGRLTLGILGTRDDPLADLLGRGLQRINILRDLAEDSQRGRLYLPAPLLARHGLPADPAACLRHPALLPARQEFADQAAAEITAALARIDALPPGVPRRPLYLMADAYRRLLVRVMALSPECRARLTAGDKLALLLHRRWR